MDSFNSTIKRFYLFLKYCVVTFLCHHTQHDFVCNCHMYVICIDRNTTDVDKLQVAIKYTFDLTVCNVYRGHIASIFFSRGCICLSHNISKPDRNC